MEEEFVVDVDNRPSPEAVAAWQEFFSGLEVHETHPWHKVGRCIFCGPCNIRLYQGELPPGHPVFIPPYVTKAKEASRTMRERWGKL